MSSKPLSNQQTLQQQRAGHAYKKVDAVNANQKEYGSLARGFPAMIQIDGLGHALAFLKAKAGGKHDNHHAVLYGHLGDWLHDQFPAIGGTDLLKWLTEQNSATYRHVASEAAAYLMWIRRFVEARGWEVKV